jgi:guanosine-3',5'-bis(diphosphate) 3'-pyrophosphohydrolase
MRDIAYRAMVFAREAHSDQRRKYTNDPYTVHLAEVAGIAMSVGWHVPQVHPDTFMAVCWLHDVIEDQGAAYWTLAKLFGADVALGVVALSDIEPGNRAERKAAARHRLAQAPGWIQTIKVADLISNTASIVLHDPKFAQVYIPEAQQMIDVLTRADDRLREVASQQLSASRVKLQEGVA